MKFFGKIKLKWSESILISLMALVMMFLFQRYWLIPNSQKLVEIQTKTIETKKKIEEAQNLLSNFKTRMPASVEVKNAQSLLDRYITSNDRFSKVITGIFAGSKDGSFSISKISTERSTQVGAYTQTLYQLEAESSFIAIGKFLETLEDSPLLTEVESIDISRIESEMKRCKASIRLYGYVGGLDK